MTLNYEEKKKERKNVMLFRRDLIKTISSVFVRHEVHFVEVQLFVLLLTFRLQPECMFHRMVLK